MKTRTSSSLILFFFKEPEPAVLHKFNQLHNTDKYIAGSGWQSLVDLDLGLG
jgi:hypothetical protein